MPTPSRVFSFALHARPVLVAALLAAGATLAAPPASAIPASGQFSIAGSLLLFNGADFLPVGGGQGSFIVLAPSTGSFAGVPMTTGTISDLSLSGVGALPPGTTLSLAVLPSLSFDLTFLHPGTFSAADCFAAPAPGQTCTPAGSALQLANGPVGSTLSFSVSGLVTNTLGEQSELTGTFTAQFGIPYQHVFATLAAGSFVEAAYSAVFDVVPVPEGSRLALLALGALALGLRRRRPPTD